MSGHSPLYRWLPRRGPLALVTVFGPYLYPALMLLLARARGRHVWLMPSLLMAALASVERLASRSRVRRATPGARAFSVMSWNILFDNPRSDEIVCWLATGPADVIALQELTAEDVERIAGAPVLRRAYPHQIVWGYGVGAGMGLLSRFPILQQGKLELPPAIWARLDLGDRRTVVLVNAHPTFFPPWMVKEAPKARWSLMESMGRLFDRRFLSYDPRYRDDGITRIRRWIEPLVRQGEALLVVGDFNVTEREPAYDELTADLQDVYCSVGAGSGHTWRPEWLKNVPLPILRIDYMLSSSGIRPLRMWVDRRSRGSDHSAIYGVFELPPGQAGALQ